MYYELLLLINDCLGMWAFGCYLMLNEQANMYVLTHDYVNVFPAHV